MSAPQSEDVASGAQRRAADVALLVALKLGLGAYVLFAGFLHVSDDDYARTVIAQQFAHAPRFDPSATSWLPLPFWLTGAAMAAAGRSLATARAVAIVLGAASVAAPYLALRRLPMGRWPALWATAIAMALPWNAWLGVATVPEAWTGALLAAAVLAMADRKARPWAAAALLAASLSRYEAWPACAVCAGLCAVRALRGPARANREWVWAAVALAGPALWMAWNAHAHGSAVHFLDRVSSFRRTTGAANLPLRDKLLGYPRALVLETPEAAALGLVGAIGLAVSPSLRSRWAWAVASALAIMAFLVEGDLRDGAPTHHPERALAALWWVLPGLGVDSLACAIGSYAGSARPRRARPIVFAAVAATCAWSLTLGARYRAYPGNTDWERRDAQIARGTAMRERHVPSATITPCAYEHFALLAAWGEPERAHLNPPLHLAPTADCPQVVEP